MTLELESLIAGFDGDPRFRADLDEHRSQALMNAMLSSAIAPRRVEAIVRAYGERRPSLAETIGFMRALDAHVRPLQALAERPRPVVLPSYSGTRAQPNLTALVALMLKRYGATVVLHGSISTKVVRGGAGSAAGDAEPHPATTIEILRELGIEPAADMADAQGRLARGDIAYIPLELFAPGVEQIASAGGAVSRNGFLHALVQLLDPLGGNGYRVIAAQRGEDFAWMREFLAATRATALLLRGTDDEPFADPAMLPKLESFTAGVATADDDGDAEVITAAQAPALDAVATAEFIARVLKGEQPVPDPILAQLAYCLAGARRG
jgi:anthranilate phosphoribosyltransferase